MSIGFLLYDRRVGCEAVHKSQAEVLSLRICISSSVILKQDDRTASFPSLSRRRHAQGVHGSDVLTLWTPVPGVSYRQVAGQIMGGARGSDLVGCT